MRGEDTLATLFVGVIGGSPPHARGRLRQRRLVSANSRITPACAGKTPRRGPIRLAGWDHPRMRGEDKRHESQGRGRRGSPPHARGRLVGVV